MTRESDDSARKLKGLIERVKTDPSEFAQIVSILQPYMMWVAGKVLHNPEDIMDVVQDAMLKIWKYRTKYDPEAASVKTWAGRITINVAIDVWRRSTRSKAESLSKETDFLADKGRTPENAAEERDFFDKVRELLRGLTDRDREPIELHYLEGYTYAKAADHLNITQGAFLSRLARARAELRFRMGVNARPQLKHDSDQTSGE